MLAAVLVTLLVGAASASKYFPNHQPLSDELVNYINYEIQTTWKAGKNFQAHGMTTAGLKRMCGVLSDPKEFKLPEREPHLIEDRDVPESFDSRTNWPNCKSIK